jgi:hypothetical protein
MVVMSIVKLLSCPFHGQRSQDSHKLQQIAEEELEMKTKVKATLKQL